MENIWKYSENILFVKNGEGGVIRTQWAEAYTYNVQNSPNPMPKHKMMSQKRLLGKVVFEQAGAF